MRRQLEAERNQVLQQAREAGALQGQEQGYAAGLDQGRAEWADRVAALDALLASLSNKLEAGIAGSEDLMVEIVFESVSKIIGNAALRREGVAAIVQQALQGIGEREILVLRLAPRDVDLLRDLRAELTRFADCRSLELVADERVELGGCLIETSGGGLDGRLETQFQRLRDLLLAARGPVESKT